MNKKIKTLGNIRLYLTNAAPYFGLLIFKFMGNVYIFEPKERQYEY
jgi:hypothetical protein